MKLSEYIEKLQLIQQEFGDLEVVDSHENSPAAPEEVEGMIVFAEEA